MNLPSLSLPAPLRRRDFRLFWLGQWVSRVGDAAFLVAQNWLVWELTGSGAAVATVTLFAQVPSTAMLLVGGALVDRLPRRWVSITSDLLRGGLLLVMAALASEGLLRIQHLYGLAAAFGVVSAFAQPAFRALLQALTRAEDRVAANALVSAGATVAGIAGPALGGLMVGLGGVPTAFLLNGLSFFAAALGLLLAQAPEPDRANRRHALRPAALLRDLTEALRLLAGQRFLLTTMAALALIIMVGQAPVVILRPWAMDRAGGRVGALSLTYTCFSAGMFATTALLGALNPRRRRGLLIYLGLGAAGLLQAGMAIATAPWQLWTLDFLLGGAVMAYSVLWPVLLQDRIPPEAMGRVAAIDQFSAVVLYPVGIALVGGLSTVPGGPELALVGGGLLTAAVAAGAILLPWVRRQD